jgi:hypothetical protein
MVISRALVRRAQLFLQGLARASVEHGWDVVPPSDPRHGTLARVAHTATRPSTNIAARSSSVTAILA